MLRCVLSPGERVYVEYHRQNRAIQRKAGEGQGGGDDDDVETTGNEEATTPMRLRLIKM